MREGEEKKGRGNRRKSFLRRDARKPDLPFKFDSKPFRKFGATTTTGNIPKYFFFMPRAMVDFFPRRVKKKKKEEKKKGKQENPLPLEEHSLEATHL